MFWEDTPFVARARFMHDNVMELSEDFLQNYDAQQYPGYASFRELLLTMYGTPDAFQGADALERFHALSYSTQVFFSAVAETGVLAADGDSLHVAKAAFKKAYKKPGNAPFEALPHFGLVFEYSKKELPAASYAACDAFTLRFPQGSGIAAALKQLALRFSEVDHKREYGDALVVLGKADYDRLLLGRPAIREEIGVLRPDIVRSTGEGAVFYEEIARQAEHLGLLSAAYMQRYANPTWNINFLRGKKLRLKTMWCEGRNFVHVPIPFAHAESVIRRRHALPPRMQEAIEHFGCVQCGRCKSSNAVQFRKVDGITVCSGHGESSTIFLSIESLEEVGSIFEVIASLD